MRPARTWLDSDAAVSPISATLTIASASTSAKKGCGRSTRCCAFCIVRTCATTSFSGTDHASSVLLKTPPKKATGRSCQAAIGLSISRASHAATKPAQPTRDASLMTMSVSSSAMMLSSTACRSASLHCSNAASWVGPQRPVSGTLASARLLLLGARCPAAASRSTSGCRSSASRGTLPASQPIMPRNVDSEPASAGLCSAVTPST